MPWPLACEKSQATLLIKHAVKDSCPFQFRPLRCKANTEMVALLQVLLLGLRGKQLDLLLGM